MVILLLILLVLILSLLLLWLIWIVHEISTTLLIRLVLSTQIVLLLIWVDRLRKGGWSGGVDSGVGGIIIVLVLEREVESQAIVIVVWFHLDQ